MTTNEVPGFRIERDTMGEVEVPAEALWGAQTQRAVQNFPVSGRGLEPAHIRALAQIKGAAAQVNAELGVIPLAVAEAIATAAAHVADGTYDDHFPIDVFQTGSGTSSNMNANEVIATLAARVLGRPVHPNDHVNASQSSNDVFPSSIHLAATYAVLHDLVPALRHLDGALSAKAEEFASVVKSGRTHLMDATPVTLGQEFSGYAAQVRYGIERLEASLPRLAELPLGGTAVGTGINTPPGFAAAVIGRLREMTGLPLTEARNHFEAQGARDALVEASGQLRTIAVGLYKIANDIRWMGSGPRAGLRELRLPDLQPGSSIMPGKVNPVVCESVRQVCAQVIGNDAAVGFAGSQGDFELNVMLPVMGRNLLESIRLLAAVSRLLADRCVVGLVADEDMCREYAEGSPSIATPLNRFLGYDEVASIAKQALAEGKSIRSVVIERGHVEAGRLTEQQLDEALDVLRMTRPAPEPPAGTE
ncbi:fumarase, class II [Micromonospora pattaloongensis]|uniref:Fumarate hydratase class II n=1 Tax=Micromonospora pattaloongensis TaxID=405436 RepID=A0A1H3H6V9_9ACTN|nr:class II fumarate hydratase [Micromonospora pattaloongensis]SDY10648.1 fumarase, class II [Micromonospora pattaloongensis]